MAEPQNTLSSSQAVVEVILAATDFQDLKNKMINRLIQELESEHFHAVLRRDGPPPIHELDQYVSDLEQRLAELKNLQPKLGATNE